MFAVTANVYEVPYNHSSSIAFNETSRLELHVPAMFAVKAKIYGVIYTQSSFIGFDETSSYYWSAPKSS